MRHVGPLFGLVWRTNRALTLATIVVRLVRAMLPVITLYIGKLIIDEVIAKAALPHAPVSFSAWLDSGLLDRAMWLIGAEFGLAIISDLTGRAGSLFDMMLGAQFSIATSIRLMLPEPGTTSTPQSRRAISTPNSTPPIRISSSAPAHRPRRDWA